MLFRTLLCIVITTGCCTQQKLLVKRKIDDSATVIQKIIYNSPRLCIRSYVSPGYDMIFRLSWVYLKDGEKKVKKMKEKNKKAPLKCSI